MKKYETQFAKMVFGWGFLELGGKYACFFEQNNMADSVFYLLALSGALFGVYLFVDGCLKLYLGVTVKKPLNTITKQHIFQDVKVEVKNIMKFLKDRRGEASAKSIIGLAIGFVLMAVLAPIGLDQIYAANTTLWETAVTTIFTLVLPIVFIIGGAMKFVSDIRD